MSVHPERVLLLWIPDWPALAHRLVSDELDADAPLALTEQQRVVACTPEARGAGVRAGMRERDAVSLCPELAAFPHDHAISQRTFDPVLSAIRQRVPEVEALRPGLCAMRARGPARFYGSEEAAATVVLDAADAATGLTAARAGVADGRFAAEQAARANREAPGVDAPHERIRLVASERTRRFLAPLPVSRAAEPALAETLFGLGIRTLGALAALPESSVRQRFGPAGVAARLRALGTGSAAVEHVRPTAAPRDFAVEAAFEPPLDGADQLAFACVPLAERMLADLAEAGLVCTGLRVEISDDIGVRHERVWDHPHRFTAADAANRVRWQLQALPRAPERGGAGIGALRLVPERTDRAAAHEPGLWNTGPDARVHHHLSRLQSRFGPDGVGTLAIGGGRLLASRQHLVPWNTRGPGHSVAAGSHGPWPGSLPGPAPSRIFSPPLNADLRDATGGNATIDHDDLLVAAPATLEVPPALGASRVAAWSRPWPVRERWWRGSPGRHRLQVALDEGDAWLLLHASGRWFAEGRYD